MSYKPIFLIFIFVFASSYSFALIDTTSNIYINSSYINQTIVNGTNINLSEVIYRNGSVAMIDTFQSRSIIPTSNKTYDLGNTTNFWNNMYSNIIYFNSIASLNGLSRSDAVTLSGRFKIDPDTSPDISSGSWADYDLGTNIRPAAFQANSVAAPGVNDTSKSVVEFRGAPIIASTNWNRGSSTTGMMFGNDGTGVYGDPGSAYLNYIGAKVYGSKGVWAQIKAQTNIGLYAKGFVNDQNGVLNSALYSAAIYASNDDYGYFAWASPVENYYPHQFGYIAEVPTYGTKNWQMFLQGTGTGTGTFYGGSSFVNLISNNANSNMATMGNWVGTNWYPNGAITYADQNLAGSGYSESDQTLNVIQSGATGGTVQAMLPNGYYVVATGTGTNYTIASNVSTTCSGCPGTGKTVNIWAVEYLRHTPGSTANLTLANSYLTTGSIKINHSYVIIFKVSAPTGTLAGNVTPYLGNVKGTVQTTTGIKYVQITANSTTANITFSPSSTFNGAISQVEIYDISIWNYARVYSNLSSTLSLAVDVNGTEYNRLTVTPNGVGIYNQNPTYKLQVSGNTTSNDTLVRVDGRIIAKGYDVMSDYFNSSFSPYKSAVSADKLIYSSDEIKNFTKTTGEDYHLIFRSGECWEEIDYSRPVKLITYQNISHQQLIKDTCEVSFDLNLANSTRLCKYQTIIQQKEIINIDYPYNITTCKYDLSDEVNIMREALANQITQKEQIQTQLQDLTIRITAIEKETCQFNKEYSWCPK